jgi:hypothetical protein
MESVDGQPSRAVSRNRSNRIPALSGVGPDRFDQEAVFTGVIGLAAAKFAVRGRISGTSERSQSRQTSFMSRPRNKNAARGGNSIEERMNIWRCYNLVAVQRCASQVEFRDCCRVQPRPRQCSATRPAELWSFLTGDNLLTCDL